MKAEKTLKSIPSLFATIAITLAGVVSARAGVVFNISVPLDIMVPVPCANGGAGEMVHLTGPLHLRLSVTTNSVGGFSVVQHAQPQGVSGTGLTTGLSYNATGETDTTFNANAGVQQTFVNNFKIIGQGPGNNFTVHENAHVTINANGTATASVDNFTSDCH
jgi:hypothetical protein